MNINQEAEWEVGHKYDGVIYPGYPCSNELKQDILNNLIVPGQHVKALDASVESVCIYDARVVVVLIPDTFEIPEHDPDCDCDVCRTSVPHDKDCGCDVCRLGPDAAKWLNQPGEY